MATTVTLNDNAIVTTTEAEEYIWDDPSVRTDEEKDVLYRIINAVSTAVENYIHRDVIEVERTQYFDGGTDEIFLKNYPISSITSVYEDGEQLDDPSGQAEDDGDYDYYAEMGIIYRSSGYFAIGRQKVRVIYTSGIASDVESVPDDLKMAALSWIEQIFEQDIENYSTIITEGSTIRPSGMPGVAYKLLEPYTKRRG